MMPNQPVDSAVAGGDGHGQRDAWVRTGGPGPAGRLWPGATACAGNAGMGPGPRAGTGGRSDCSGGGARRPAGQGRHRADAVGPGPR
ncbi:hypothetical protein G6F32_014743 [Rhizopus arrhizus]|nr:hypothetical protein G6F32_014743 [Rhizopus arrhizus]